MSNWPFCNEFNPLDVWLIYFECIYTEFIYIYSVLFSFLLRITLVIADSRGRKVLPLLDHPDIVCRFFPGASLEDSLPRIHELVMRYHPVSCLITLGVNDLTYIDRQLRYVYPRICDPFFLANSIIKKMIYIRKSLMKAQSGLRVIFSGLNGIDLNKYNRLDGKSTEQFVIDDCVTQVNSYVRILNRLDGNYHPRLTSKVHTWRKGRRVNRYHLLYDGLHFGEIVTHSWVWAICRFHKRNTLDHKL